MLYKAQDLRYPKTINLHTLVFLRRAVYCKRKKVHHLGNTPFPKCEFQNRNSNTLIIPKVNNLVNSDKQLNSEKTLWNNLYKNYGAISLL